MTNSLKMKPLPDIEVLKEMLAYDAESGELRWKVARGGKRCGDVAGVKDTRGYVKVSINRKDLYGHRIAWALHYGENPELYIDHKNGDRSDNRIANLRLANASENTLNTPLRGNNNSGHRGVCWMTGYKKWRAQITLRGKQVILGYYDNKEDAINARLKAEADNNIYVRAS